MSTPAQPSSVNVTDDLRAEAARLDNNANTEGN